MVGVYDRTLTVCRRCSCVKDEEAWTRTTLILLPLVDGGRKPNFK
jgi:hypothetical protein